MNFASAGSYKNPAESAHLFCYPDLVCIPCQADTIFPDLIVVTDLSLPIGNQPLILRCGDMCRQESVCHGESGQKYDEQKEKALKKLAESEANLGKVETQLQERRRQLERLEAERKDALRYASVRDQIQQTRIESLAWTIIKGNNRTKAIDETLAERAAEAEKLTKDQVEKLDKPLDELRKALAGKDVELIKAKSETLAKVLQEVGTVVYQQAAQERAKAEQTTSGEPPQGEPEKKVVDAEYEVKDEKK
jgi:chromosome segregation ATPase